MMPDFPFHANTSYNGATFEYAPITVMQAVGYISAMIERLSFLAQDVTTLASFRPTLLEIARLLDLLKAKKLQQNVIEMHEAIRNADQITNIALIHGATSLQEAWNELLRENNTVWHPPK